MNTRVCIALLVLSLLLLVECRPGIPGVDDIGWEVHLPSSGTVWRRVYMPPGKPWWWCLRFKKAPACRKEEPEPGDGRLIHVGFIKISNRSYI